MRRRRRDPSPERPDRRKGRPSPPPPAILHGSAETIAGLEILDEFREPLGTVLWQVLHDVHLWAGAAPHERRSLFAPGAQSRMLAVLQGVQLDAELKGPLTELSDLLGSSERGEPERIASACRRVAEWAERREALGTALAFTQAAALAAPADPEAALATTVLAARRGEEVRAESWARRTVVLARRLGNWAAYTRAYLELGHLYARRGNPLAARRLYLSALRRAQRVGPQQLRGEALHALSDLARQAGTPDNVDALARAALRAYGAAHPNAPDLLRAWTRYRLSRDPALSLLGESDAPLPLRGPAVARAYLFAVVARVAAEVGAREEFERAWDEAGRILDRLRIRKGEGGDRLRTLLELAHAAVEVESWERAEYAGQRALEVAMRLGDPATTAEVDSFLSALWARTGRMGWIGRPHGPRRKE